MTKPQVKIQKPQKPQKPQVKEQKVKDVKQAAPVPVATAIKSSPPDPMVQLNVTVPASLRGELMAHAEAKGLIFYRAVGMLLRAGLDQVKT